MMEYFSQNSKIDQSAYIKLISKYTQEKEFFEFFSEKNLARPRIPASIEVGDKKLTLDLFFGRSKESTEDIIKINREYEGRVPPDYLIAGQINEIDFFCIKENGFYLWDRHKNDLYFDEKIPNKYKKQNTKLKQLSEDFRSFLKKIKPHIEDTSSDSDLDDYENPNIAFEDDAISDDFLHPELFFKQSASAIEIQLNKLKLSEKGNLLLSLFKEKGLI